MIFISQTMEFNDRIVTSLTIFARNCDVRKIDRKTSSLARRIQQNHGKTGCNPRSRLWFSLMRFAHKHFAPMEPDYGYWEEQGWHQGNRPWRSQIEHTHETPKK